MPASTQTPLSHPWPDKNGWLDSPGFRVWLVGVSAALLLALWLPPSLEMLRHSSRWFPVWLHTAAETFSIVVSVLVFAVSWHAYSPERAGNYMLLAVGFLATALLDFLHLLSYAQMPDFITPASPQKAIVFWLCARLLAAGVLLAIVMRPWAPLGRPALRYPMLLASLMLVACIAYLGLAHPEIWPVFYVPGEGLTPIKLALEWVVIGMLALTAVRLWWMRKEATPFDHGGLLTAVLLWILSELALMIYVSVNDVFSLIGHTYKVLGFLLVYRLVFVASVREPYERLAGEIAGRRDAQAQVESLAFYDVLTGLPNRALLRDRVEQACMTQVDGTTPPCALLLFNIDGFRDVNDSLGPAYGDAVLRRMGDRLCEVAGESDSAAKLDGDEFALLLRRAADADTAGAVADAVLRATQAPLQIFERELRLSASIGIALAPSDGNHFDELMQSASTALHKAKNAGGHTWRFFDPGMNREVVGHLNLLHDLRAALDRSEFTLHYQPQFDLISGELAGVEALVRWQHPQQGLLPPGKFITEAEDSGLIVPIGQWVLQEACRQAAAWRAAGIAVPLVAVNLSAKQFQRGDVSALVLAALAGSGLPPNMLELELTESILVQDAELVLDLLHRLKALGVGLSIDDFGTGYSSLAYLRRFPIDKLKIDQSFVRDLDRDAGGEAIVRAIVQLASSLGLTTIAEGVEDATTADRLRQIGCMQGQGFHFARPMTADALAHWLSTGAGAPSIQGHPTASVPHVWR